LNSKLNLNFSDKKFGAFGNPKFEYYGDIHIGKEDVRSRKSNSSLAKEEIKSRKSNTSS
jgi:hypothetical protein